MAIKTDKNNQICDIQPRVGNIFSTYHGRPFETNHNQILEEMISELNTLSKKEIDELKVKNQENLKEMYNLI